MLIWNLYAQNNPLKLNISIPPIQTLSLVHSHNFPEPDPSDLDHGFIKLDGCIELEVSSNIPWKIIAYTNESSEILNYKTLYKPDEYENIQLKTGNNPFINISTIPIEISSGTNKIQQQQVIVDCKRLVGWHKTNPGKWRVEPIFKIVPLIE